MTPIRELLAALLRRAGAALDEREIPAVPKEGTMTQTQPSEERALARSMTADQMQVPEVLDFARRVQDILAGVMVKDVHYGVIPGTPKPSLWQPGAEKIDLAFRLSPAYAVEDIYTPSPTADPRDAEYRYRVTCSLTHAPTGLVVCTAIGEASTSEERWAWRAPRSAAEWEATPERYRRIRYERSDEKQQVRTCPADMANTAAKMAAKRAHVSATRGAVAASDVFLVDVEPDTNGGDAEYAVKPKINRPQAYSRPAPAANGGSGGGERRPFAPDEEAARSVAANVPEAAWVEVRDKWGSGSSITGPQLKRLFAIASSSGWKPDDVRNVVKTFFECDLEDIPMAKSYDLIVELFQKVAPAS